jgi:hypothetical protein
MPSGDTCFTVKLRASEANSEDDVAIARDAEEGSDCAKMGESTLDKKTASVDFSVFAPVDAAQGARGNIVVLVNNQVKARYAVTFDDDPNPDATDPGMDGELMEPTGIRVNPLFALVNVEWTAGQSADGHAVLLFNADTFAFVDGDFLSDPKVDEYTFKGVAPGDYYVVVASYQDQDDDSRDYAYDGNGKDVTVN